MNSKTVKLGDTVVIDGKKGKVTSIQRFGKLTMVGVKIGNTLHTIVIED